MPEVFPSAGTYVAALVLGLTQIGGGGSDLGSVALVVPAPYHLPQFGNWAGILTSNGVHSHVELQ